MSTHKLNPEELQHTLITRGKELINLAIMEKELEMYKQVIASRDAEIGHLSELNDLRAKTLKTKEHTQQVQDERIELKDAQIKALTEELEEASNSIEYKDTLIREYGETIAQLKARLKFKLSSIRGENTTNRR